MMQACFAYYSKVVNVSPNLLESLPPTLQADPHPNLPADARYLVLSFAAAMTAAKLARDQIEVVRE